MKYLLVFTLLLMTRMSSTAKNLLGEASSDYVTAMVRRDLMALPEHQLRNEVLLKTKLSGLFRRRTFDSTLSYVEYKGRAPIANENWSMFLIAIMNTQDVLLEYGKHFNETDRERLKGIDKILSSLSNEVGALYNFDENKLNIIRRTAYNPNNFHGALMEKSASASFIRKRNRDIGKIMSIWTKVGSR